MLEVLNLGKNNISDKYPWVLSKNINLHVLVLRSNRLHGSVVCGPTQHNNWSKIQILDISHNSFRGSVPSGSVTVTVTVKGRELELVKILTLFKSIDISSNRFSGKIPDTIGQLKALYLLNISHNEFTGSIPPSIRNFSHLESLDMSSNRITGNIPSVLTSLPFLYSFSLSYNQLEGNIPTGRQFNTFDENSYIGNKRLCGFPLNRTCTILPEQKYAPNSPESNDEKDWRSIFCGLGFGVVISVLFSTRKRYSSGGKGSTNFVEIDITQFQTEVSKLSSDNQKEIVMEEQNQEMRGTTQEKIDMGAQMVGNGEAIETGPHACPGNLNPNLTPHSTNLESSVPATLEGDPKSDQMMEVEGDPYTDDSENEEGSEDEDHHGNMFSILEEGGVESDDFEQDGRVRKVPPHRSNDGGREIRNEICYCVSRWLFEMRGWREIKTTKKILTNILLCLPMAYGLIFLLRARVLGGQGLGNPVNNGKIWGGGNMGWYTPCTTDSTTCLLRDVSRWGEVGPNHANWVKMFLCWDDYICRSFGCLMGCCQSKVSKRWAKFEDHCRKKLLMKMDCGGWDNFMCREANPMRGPDQMLTTLHQTSGSCWIRTCKGWPSMAAGSGHWIIDIWPSLAWFSRGIVWTWRVSCHGSDTTNKPPGRDRWCDRDTAVTHGSSSHCPILHETKPNFMCYLLVVMIWVPLYCYLDYFEADTNTWHQDIQDYSFRFILIVFWYARPLLGADVNQPLPTLLTSPSLLLHLFQPFNITLHTRSRPSTPSSPSPLHRRRRPRPSTVARPHDSSSPLHRLLHRILVAAAPSITPSHPRRGSAISMVGSGISIDLVAAAPSIDLDGRNRNRS
ncbi:hypothetical protein R6Q59_026389 [Mikania micrantha]